MRKNPSIDFELTVNNKTATYSSIKAAKARHDKQSYPRRNTTLLLMSGVDDGIGCYVDFIGSKIRVRFPGHDGSTIQAATVTAAADYAWGYLRNAGGHPRLFADPRRSNPSSYAGDPYWTRARFKGECCKCHGVVRKGDPIYYYPKGKRVYCDGASCGKAANQDFISMRDDEDMYNRRNPSRRNPDYDALNKEHRRLKTMLTRAKNSGDPKKVIAACRAAVKAWSNWPAWPDDWSRWEIALGDAQPWGPNRLELSDLESRSNPKRRNPSHADCPGGHSHYQGKCFTDWNWGTGANSNEARKVFPKFGFYAIVKPGTAGYWTWHVHSQTGPAWPALKVGSAGSSSAAKAAVTKYMETVGRSRSRSNPGLGMPGMPHTWVTASGVHVHGGDTVEFWDIAGHPRGHNPVKVRAKVNKLLVFDDHVQVSKGWAGTRVDDRNFIRVVRRA